MGRRSIHSPEELRQLILDASRNIIEQHGIAGLSAREIARAIGYSPGTIYNTFSNLDDVLVNVQVQLLERVHEDLKNVQANDDVLSYIEALTQAYVRFAIDNRRLWNLLFAHTLPVSMAAPVALQDHVDAMVDLVNSAFSQIDPTETREKVAMKARALCAGVHGVTAIAVTDKGRHVTAATAQQYAAELVQTFMRGLLGPQIRS